MDHILAHQHGMPRAPWLGAPFGGGESLRQIVEILEHYLHRHMSLIARDNLLAKFLLKIMADHKHDFAKAGSKCVVDRIVHNGLS